MKVLVTGALGNVGAYTLDALLREGHDVVAFDVVSTRARKAAARVDSRVRVVWGDICEPASVGAALDGVEAVVHLAAIIPPQVEKAPDLARRINVDGTRNLIEQMIASGTARRLVFASSMGVFGDVQDREPPLRAQTPVSPTDDYGRHKVACEQAIQASVLHWSILRLAVAVPTRLRGAPFDVRTGFEISADARVEIIHPADAATAFAHAVDCEAVTGKILHVGGGEKCQLRHADFFNELMGGIGIGPLPAEAFIRREFPRFMGDWVDTQESQRLLRYQERGLEELKEDMRSDLGLLVPLIRLFRPLVNGFMLRASPYLQENRRARG